MFLNRTVTKRWLQIFKVPSKRSHLGGTNVARKGLRPADYIKEFLTSTTFARLLIRIFFVIPSSFLHVTLPPEVVSARNRSGNMTSENEVA